MARWLKRLLPLAAVLLAWSAAAQTPPARRGEKTVTVSPDRYRGAKRTVSGGLLPRPDTLRRADSLAADPLRDSLAEHPATADSLAREAAVRAAGTLLALTDSLALDSLQRTRLIEALAAWSAERAAIRAAETTGTLLPPADTVPPAADSLMPHPNGISGDPAAAASAEHPTADAPAHPTPQTGVSSPDPKEDMPADSLAGAGNDLPLPQTPPAGVRTDSLAAATNAPATGPLPAATDSLSSATLPAAERLPALLDGLELDSLQCSRIAATLAEVAASGADPAATAEALLRRTSLTEAGLDSLRRAAIARETDSLPRRRSWLMSDSMSLSKVCWISTVLPGYGQIYNRQYWKLPILYTAVGASLGMFIHENNQFRPLKRRYDELTNLGLERTPELDIVQSAMIKHNTRRQIFLFTTIASYIYFIGDAAVNYSTNDVSSVKKATTLATICPGAGQIYNKSYWKVPIVVGGFATLAYMIDWNNRGYQRFKKAYRLRAEWDRANEAHNADPSAPEPPAQSTDEFKGRYSASFLKNLKDSYRRNRDLCIIATAGVYLLQIVDAHVDAHLKDFDVSDDLSARLEPSFDYQYIAGDGVRPVVGFNFRLNF